MENFLRIYLSSVYEKYVLQTLGMLGRKPKPNSGQIRLVFKIISTFFIAFSF